jgi:alanine-glyoxylate transaminase/serine-glyoxylate transaminase/serine-pyruvate transaminase
MAEMVRRCGGLLREVQGGWGDIIEMSQVEKVLKEERVKVVCIVQAETSTGVLQPLDELSQVVHEHGALLLVDAVTSLGGMSVGVDENRIDACYSGTQKCLSCPPGLSPITFSSRALDLIQSRKSQVQSWYLDINLLMGYWGEARVYHHTAPISMIYALHESLRLIVEEGLSECFQRHRRNHAALVAGLEAMGLKLLVEPALRAPSITTVLIPDGVDDARVRGNLLQEHRIEIGGGLGDLKGRVWRIGLMGHSSRRKSLLRVLKGLEEVLKREKFPVAESLGIEAAEKQYASQE